MTIKNNGDNVLSGFRLPLKLANKNNVYIPRHNNMSLLRFEFSGDSCAATLLFLPFARVVGKQHCTKISSCKNCWPRPTTMGYKIVHFFKKEFRSLYRSLYKLYNIWSAHTYTYICISYRKDGGAVHQSIFIIRDIFLYFDTWLS